MPYDWAVQQLRLSVFSNEPVSLTETVWKKITDQEEAEHRAALPGGKQYSGKWSGGLFVMSYSANRVDFILTYDDSTVDLTQEVVSPTIGKWEELSKSFATKLSPTLSELPFPVARVAFGAILLLPVADREGAYRKLDDLLISVDVDTNSKELTFRINWPTKSKTDPGLEINRITAWSSIQYTRTITLVTGGSGGPAAEAKAHFVRMEVDHSTDQNRQEPFEKAKLVPIFEELLDLARENAETGECK